MSGSNTCPYCRTDLSGSATIAEPLAHCPACGRSPPPSTIQSSVPIWSPPNEETRSLSSPMLGQETVAEHQPSNLGLPSTVAFSNLPSPSKTVPLPSVPGYECLRVLGRGGMGVVYLA